MRCPEPASRAASAAGVALLAIATLAGGCASRDPWLGYETSLYSTLKSPSREAYDRHLEYLVSVIDWRREHQQRPPPGIAAECALYASMLERPDEASRYLALEKEQYPESAGFDRVLERLISGEKQLLSPEEPGAPDAAPPAGAKDAASGPPAAAEPGASGSGAPSTAGAADPAGAEDPAGTEHARERAKGGPRT